MQLFFRAADWVVLPYRKILTSGSLLCALSFERPCIASRLGMIEDLLRDGENGLLYDPTAPEGLVEAMERGLGLKAEDRARMEAAAAASLDGLSWDSLGASLAAAMGEALRAPFTSAPALQEVACPQ